MEDLNKSSFTVGCAIYLTIFSIAIFVLLGIVWYGVSSGWLTSTAAIPQNKIPKKQLREIDHIVGLGPTEIVLYFYSTTMTVSGDGNLFTNERVISYTDFQVIDATYGEIEEITFNQSTSWLEDSTIAIFLLDGTTFSLWVSTESGRDKEFYNRLVQEWEQNRDTECGITNQ